MVRTDNEKSRVVLEFLFLLLGSSLRPGIGRMGLYCVEHDIDSSIHGQRLAQFNAVQERFAKERSISILPKLELGLCLMHTSCRRSPTPLEPTTVIGLLL